MVGGVSWLMMVDGHGWLVCCDWLLVWISGWLAPWLMDACSSWFRGTCAPFQAFDVDGDGTLSPQEWESALAVPYVQQYLQMLDVRIADCRQLFGILGDGRGGAITIHEFCDWLKRVKGEARAADVVVLQHATEKVMKECKAGTSAIRSTVVNQCQPC